MGGWMGVKAGLKIAYSNQKYKYCKVRKVTQKVFDIHHDKN